VPKKIALTCGRTVIIIELGIKCNGVGREKLILTWGRKRKNL
jgi:hypothetical protein